MSRHLIESLRQWPSCPEGADPFSSIYVSDLMCDAAVEIERLRKGVQDMLDGNYPHPRSYRPKPCPHGEPYYHECSLCDEAALTAILEPPRAASEPTGPGSASSVS